MSRCRSCGASILWRETPNGRKMPVNADARVALRPGPGAGAVVDSLGSVHRGELLGEVQPDDLVIAGAVYGRIPHWATCPNAADHKRGRAAS